MSKVAPVIAVFATRWTASAAMAAGPATRPGSAAGRAAMSGWPPGVPPGAMRRLRLLASSLIQLQGGAMSTTEDRTSGELRDGYAEIGDVKLHYVEAGEGPLIVLLHGFPEFWYGWRL